MCGRVQKEYAMCVGGDLKTIEFLKRRKSYLEEKLKEVDGEVAKVDSYYHQLRYLDVRVWKRHLSLVTNQGEEITGG